ncbi:hypothetical protein NMY22_g4897 [Coprinellus aureogranulatus]|nr:hypothetical protein NMY22_g4897 [Coprinellus aureogranulatus]
MNSSTPGELMARIVREVAELADPDHETRGGNEDIKSLCLAAKFCVPHCQRFLFRSVSLQPATIVATEGEFVNAAFNYNTFSALMAESPHLGSYVKSLAYNLPGVAKADIGTDGISFALEQLNGVLFLELSVDEIPRNSALMWSPHFRLFDRQHYEDFPRHAKALLAILQRPILQSLTLRNVELPSCILVGATGLQTLDLRRSYIMPSRQYAVFDPPPAFYLPKYVIFSIASASEPHISPKTLKLDDEASNAILTFTLRDPEVRSAIGLSFSQVEELWVAAEPPEIAGGQSPYATGNVLGHTGKLKVLRLRDPFPIPAEVEYPTSPLTKIHPASFDTLKKLSYEIRILMGNQSSMVRDLYHGLFRNDALAGLAALEEVDIQLFGHLDTALTQSEGGRRMPQLKKVKLSLVLSNKLTDTWYTSELACDIEKYAFGTAFPRLRELSSEGGLELVLEGKLDRDPDRYDDDDDEDEDEDEGEDDEGDIVEME